MTRIAARSLNDDSGFFSNFDLPQRRKPGIMRTCGVPIYGCWPQVMGTLCGRICPPLRSCGGAAEVSLGSIRGLLLHFWSRGGSSRNISTFPCCLSFVKRARHVVEHCCSSIKVEDGKLSILAGAASFRIVPSELLQPTSRICDSTESGSLLDPPSRTSIAVRPYRSKSAIHTIYCVSRGTNIHHGCLAVRYSQDMYKSYV